MWLGNMIQYWGPGEGTPSCRQVVDVSAPALLELLSVVLHFGHLRKAGLTCQVPLQIDGKDSHT